MNILFFGFLHRNLFKQIYLVSAFVGLSFQLVLSMESPFYTQSVSPESSSSPNKLKQALDFKGLLKRQGEALASKEYGRRLQLLASGLFVQDCFFSRLADYDKALKELIAIQTIEYDEQLEESRDLAITLLTYRDLLLLGDLEKISESLPEIRVAIKALEGSENTIVTDLLEQKIEIFEKKNAEKQAIEQARTCFNVITKKSSGYFSDVKESALPYKKFIAKQIEPIVTAIAFALLTPLPKMSAVAHLEKYREQRQAYQELYKATVNELSVLRRSKLIDSSFCYRLEDSSELLPGIEVGLVAILPIAAPDLGESEGYFFAESSKEATSPTKKKKKGKRFDAIIQPEVKDEIVDKAPVELKEKESLASDVLPKNVGAAISVPQQQQKTIQFLDEKNSLVRSWTLYKVPLKNKESITRFLPRTYTAAIHNWQKDPERILRAEYSDPKSVKYQIAYKKTYYKNDDEMRDYMKAYHSFPVAIDDYLAEYGRLEREKKGVKEGHIAITMFGEMQLQDGSVERGFFTYFIDPKNRECYHRLFVPSKKSVLDPSFYDIDFPSLS